jgi:hypothetical protein
MGTNQIPIDIPYSQIKQNNFPIDWTSTQLEGAIPNLCDKIGYDK